MGSGLGGEQEIAIGGKNYVLVYPCDTPVVLAYFDGGEQDLMPVAEEEVDALFPAAYKACADQEMELINSAVVLTLQGDLDEDLDDDEDAFGEAGEDEEFVKVITSFKDGGMEYLVTEPLEPVLIIAKPSAKGKEGDDRDHYECLPEDEVEAVMPQVLFLFCPSPDASSASCCYCRRTVLIRLAMCACAGRADSRGAFRGRGLGAAGGTQRGEEGHI